MLVLSSNLSNIANENSNEENKDNTQEPNGEQNDNTDEIPEDIARYFNLSSLQESNSSVRSLIEKLPAESQPNMMKLINDGTINMTCK